MNRVLAVRGQVVPGLGRRRSSCTPRCATGREVEGQSKIAATTGIERVWLSPDGVARLRQDALAAIAEADLIVIGPGSLFTSVLPSLLLPEIRDAVAASTAPRIYVCNVATQTGRDRRLRPGRPRRGARTAHGERHRRRRPGQQPDDGHGPDPAVRPVGDVDPAALATGVDAAAPARPRRRRRPGQPASTTTRPGWPPRSSGSPSATAPPGDAA